MLILLSGVVIAIVQLYSIHKQIKNEYFWGAREKALSYSLIKSPQLRDARIHIDVVFGHNISSRKEPLSLEEIEVACKTDNTVYTQISALLAHWENMALSIYAGVSAEDVAREMTAGMMISYVNVFINFINHRREENPKAYDYLLKLTNEWKNIQRHPIDIRVALSSSEHIWHKKAYERFKHTIHLDK
ncbi:MAG: DUF4760 domain-containing protein [Proteobacteria bacterium]|nr:DUF4760 domain-containing protein [Pseudomonadota bacterium]